MSLLEQLRTEDEFRLGKPWRLTEKHLTVVVPIVRIGPAGKRAYVLIEEVKDKVKISDGGSIERVKVSGTDKLVLVRSGVVFEGINTQHRGVESSRVILPDSVVTIPVKCVYASSPIRPGSKMEVSEMYAPQEVHSVLLSSSLGKASQHSVWRAVSSFSANMMADSPRAQGMERPGVIDRATPDNLVGSMRSVREFRKGVDEILSKMPVDLKGQVGVVVMNIDGVLGLEMFDHPDSWEGASKAVARKYADVLANEGESTLFTLNEESVQSAVTVFLDAIKSAKAKLISENARSKTETFETDAFVGELVTIENQNIHAIVAKKKEDFKAQSAPYDPNLLRYWRHPPVPRYPYDERQRRQEPSPTIMYMTAPPVHESPMNNLLTSLNEKPKPWMELEREFTNKHMSTKTLSKNIKEAVDKGVVETLFRPMNKRATYSLTPQAKKDMVKVEFEE